MVHLLFNELLPFVIKILFSRLFLAMLSHTWMKVGSKLPYEELQIKFDFRQCFTSLLCRLRRHELLPFVEISFSRLFLAMLSHTWMKVGSKLPYEKLQIKFDFCHGWPTFSWVIALCLKFVFQSSLGYDFTYVAFFQKVQWNNGCRFEFVWDGVGPV